MKSLKNTPINSCNGHLSCKVQSVVAAAKTPGEILGLLYGSGDKFLN